MFSIDSYVVRGLGKQGTLEQELSFETFAIRHTLKSIYACEERGITEEPYVIEVVEQPQV